MAVSGYVHANRKKDIKLQEKTTTTNGIVKPDSDYDGLSQVTVNVPTGGGGDDNPLIASNNVTMESYLVEDNVGKVALFTGESDEEYEQDRLYSIEYVIPKYTHIHFQDFVDDSSLEKALPLFEPLIGKTGGDDIHGMIIIGDDQYDIAEDQYVFLVYMGMIFFAPANLFNDVATVTEEADGLKIDHNNGETTHLTPSYDAFGDDTWKSFQTFIVLQDTPISYSLANWFDEYSTSEVIVPTVIPKGTQITLNDTIDISAETMSAVADFVGDGTYILGYFFNMQFKATSDNKEFTKFGLCTDFALQTETKNALVFGIQDSEGMTAPTAVYKDGAYVKEEYKTIEFTEDYVAHHRWFSENSNLDTVLGVK